GDQRRKRAPRDKIPLLRGDGQPAGYFACPFRKHDPRKYSLLEWPRCSEKPQKSIARLKAHLYQYHLIEHCIRCKSVFTSAELLRTHTMGPRCEINAEEQVFGMTVDMQKQIRCRKKPNPGQTEHEKWEQIYRILFPGEDVPDPYFEPVLDHDAGRPQSPDSVNISQYEAYLRRILPQYVRNALEEAVNSEIQPIEAQIQRRMMEIIQDAQNRAFMSFRNNRISEYESRSP
ncbi:hypothetical protein BGZ57DRAFT_741393, partial [Hyaloscypha finlandica]